MQVYLCFLIFHDPPPFAQLVARTIAAFTAVFQVPRALPARSFGASQMSMGAFRCCMSLML